MYICTCARVALARAEKLEEVCLGNYETKPIVNIKGNDMKKKNKKKYTYSPLSTYIKRKRTPLPRSLFTDLRGF